MIKYSIYLFHLVLIGLWFAVPIDSDANPTAGQSVEPILTRAEPNSDMVSGGATIKIIGENFQDGATVTIGGRAASNVIFVSSTELIVKVPAGAAGSVNIVVTNPDGKSGTLTGGFKYNEPPPPTLSRVEPDNAVTTGGATIKIIGENFQDGATVTIGGNAASNIRFVSPTELEVEAPAGVAGSANVVVTNPDGKSVTVAGGFTYTPLRHDVTGDGIVNILDLVRVASQFGETGTGLEGDVDNNGVVNILDLVVVANHFSQE